MAERLRTEVEGMHEQPPRDRHLGTGLAPP